jgi:hypothetical protein
MEVRITHQGRILAELEIFQDGQVQVRSAQQGNAQYVWGSQGPQPQGAAQYVWGSQAPQGAAQYVWGATNSRPPGASNSAVLVDCPAFAGSGAPQAPQGPKVTQGLLEP